MAGWPTDEIEQLARAHEAAERLRGAIARRVVGQQAVVEQMLVALFAGGHALSIGVPGLAKTLLIQTLAEAMQLGFARIQFTPDMMPADVTGSDVLEEDRGSGQRSYRFLRGPVFTNVLLADELNRTPPKTQAALLQAMAERQVSAGGRTMPLEAPFLVLATQNPIEQHGTYPLPEAQLDRFMLAIEVDYPSEEDEVEIVRRTAAGSHDPIAPVIDKEEVLAIQRLVRELPVADHVVRYAVRLVRASRPADASCPAALQNLIAFGASPRASQWLVAGARARAVLLGKKAPEREDVDALAVPVLAHRLVPSFRAEAEGRSAADLVRSLVRELAVHA
ncbi:MAG: MoxR family ATPase [Deltaproteobacteria bacterium]|nr:MoxR family ATPase [Deltaproteobacteria bacterium]